MITGLADIRVVCFVALTLVAGCHAKRPAAARQPAPLTPVAEEIQRRGYEAKESFIVAPTAWEGSTLRMRSKRYNQRTTEQLN